MFVTSGYRQINRQHCLFWRAAFYQFAFLLLSTLILNTSLAADKLMVRYPETKNPVFVQRNNYSLELIGQAFAKINQPYVLKSVKVDIGTSARNTRFLFDQNYDISWLHTNNHREQLLRPIRIPIFKGLIGWRVFFIRKDDIDRFATISQRQQLQSLRAIQGYGWPDNEILLSNNFVVRQTLLGNDTTNIIKLMRNKRADYFPRSILEVWDEQAQFDDDTLVVEPSLAIHYPSAVYFFVSYQNPMLATALEQGLTLMVADGSFDRLFNQYFADIIAKAQLGSRRIYHLSNPHLSDKTPLNRNELWLQPSNTPKKSARVE